MLLVDALSYVQHLSFLATNLSYEHELGRLQVLDMLNQVSEGEEGAADGSLNRSVWPC
jgi:hypothetical protein